MARLQAQLLAGEQRARAVAPVVRALGAVQAQDARFAPLAVRARSRGLRAADVEQARVADRSIVWTWALRGTLHLVAAEDVPWMTALLGPVFAAAGRRRRLALGLDDALCERALGAIDAVLADAGPLTRRELVTRIAAAGVSIDAGGQAPAHLVGLAAQQGLICRGPMASAAEPTYVLTRDWLPAASDALDPDRALAELARRYLRGHQPATPADLAAWSGLGMRRARRAFELLAGEVLGVETQIGRQWTLAATALDPARHELSVALVGHFDPWLLGYASRELVLDAKHARRIQAGGGFVNPAVLVDGRVVGTWRLGGDRACTPTMAPFEVLPDDVLACVDDELADVRRFRGPA